MDKELHIVPAEHKLNILDYATSVLATCLGMAESLLVPNLTVEISRTPINNLGGYEVQDRVSVRHFQDRSLIAFVNITRYEGPCIGVTGLYTTFEIEFVQKKPHNNIIVFNPMES